MPKSRLLGAVCALSLIFQITFSFVSPLVAFASVPEASPPSAPNDSSIKYWLPVSALKPAESAPRAVHPASFDPAPVSARLRQGVTLDVDLLTSPRALLDSNSPADPDYPHVLVIEAMISNTHAISTANDVLVELDYGDEQGYWQLLEGEDANRTISTLGPYEAAYLYWFVSYPGTIGADHTYTVTVSGPDVHTTTQQDTVQTYAYLSTGNSGVIQTSAVVTVGVAFTVTVDYALGTNPTSLSFSPVGNVDFDPGAYRLLESYVRFYGDGGFEETYENQLYFATIPSTATNAVAVYTFIALTPSDTQLCPYTGVGYLNGQYKYDQFYCVDPKGGMIPIEGSLSFSMTKQVDRSIIQQGESVTYTIYYTNSGDIPLSYVWIWDDVPAGLGTITTVTPTTGTVVGEQARWYLRDVPAGATGRVGLTFTADGQGVDIADQTQGINYAFFGIDPGERPDSAALTSTVPITVVAPTIAVMKTDGETTVDAYAGLNVLTYTVRVTNSGSIPAENVLITDVVPSSVALGAVLPPTSTQQGRTLTWAVPSIAADGGVYTITIPVTVDLMTSDGTVLTNTVDVRYENGVEYPFTVELDVDTTTVRGPVLAISKNAKPAAVLIGTAPSLITYTLYYTNSGSVAATGVVVTDRVPMSTTFVAGSCAGCVTSTVGSDVVVSWTLPELSTSGYVTFSVEVADTEATSIVNGDNNGYGITSDQTGFVPGSAVAIPVSKDAALFDGYTFQDLNGNGVMDASEPIIPGVAVTLTQATTPSKTTDSTGYYSFTVESQGLVSVTAALPVGYFRTTAGTVYTYSVLGVPTQTVNFGYALNTSSFGVIRGTVYEDVNHDGLRAGEVGLAGMVVTSTLASIVTPTTTDPYGRYVFSYTVADDTPVTITADVTPPYVPTTPDEVSTLTQQGVEQEIDFGYFNGIKITGQVFSDANANGARDAGEGAVATPATVTARGTSLAVTDFFTFYLSGGSAPVEIVEADPAGYVSTNAIPLHSDVTRVDANTLRIEIPTVGTVYSGDFGDVRASDVVTISGYVWNDNGAGGGIISDGIWNNPLGGGTGAEPGLANAVVGISDGMTRTTDSTGQFSLYALPASTITLTDQTTGYISTNAIPGNEYASKVDNDTLVFGDMAAGMTSVHNLFGNVAPGATSLITGTVFDDANENGLFDVGETGISGVTVTLEMNANTIVVLTNSDGQYEFAIAPETYAWISTAAPTAYFAGIPYATTPEPILVHPTAGGVVYPDNNFGYSDDTAVAVIHGLVFDDDNSDGDQNVGELGLAGVTVTLSLNGSTPITTVTGGNGLVTGTFAFTVTEPGIYGLTEYDRIGYRSTTPNALYVNVTSTLGTSYYVVFGDTNNADRASVYGTVFYDLDSDGQQDSDEPGLGGVMISVGELTATTKPQGQFSYGFTLNLPGYYRVEEEDPARPGFHSTTPDQVTLYAERGNSYIVDFGDTDTTDYSVVMGIVFNDANGNGVQGISESGIENVPVALVAPDGSPITETQTADYGIYLLRTDTTGFASVTETDLPGYHSTTPNTVSLHIAELGYMYQVNFGDSDNANLTSFYGAVFNDQDADGLRAVTEPSLSGVTVAITGPFDFGAPASYTTNEWGQYTFLIENTGVYTVTEEGHLPGYVSTDAIPGDPAVTRVDVDTLQATVSAETLGSDLGDNLFGDAFQVQFSSTAYSVYEPDGPALITVTLKAAPSVTVTVDYATLDDTALASEDYIAATGTLTFTPGGPTELTFTVPITDDLLEEDTETLTLTLSNTQNATAFGNHPAVLSILDDEALVSIAPRTDAAEPDVNGDFVVSLSQVILQPVTVSYAVSGSATEGVDYTSLPGTVTIPAGEISATITITVRNDSLVEDDETVLLTLTGTDDVHVTVDPVSDAASLTIADNDRVTVAFSQRDYTVVETAGSAFVTVTLTGETSLATTVQYATSGGTATSGRDYVAVSGVLTFALGTTSQAFAVPILEDLLFEGEEIVDLVLTNPVNAELGTTNPATLTILDDSTGIAVIHGTVFEDSNGNGTQDAGETGISGVSVTLDDTIAETTDADGYYSFSTPTPGTHAVVETDLEGYFSTTSNEVHLNTALGNIYEVNFGDARGDVVEFAIIHGTVFEDVNGDGVWDAEELGISGVTITLDGGLIATTNIYGSYTFSTQASGSHTVVETDPEGYISTTPNTVTLDVMLGNGYETNFGDVLAPYCLCDADALEDDDVVGQAQRLTEGESQAHNFCDDATDWIVFTAEARDVYTITTSSWGRRADTILALFDRDGHTLLLEDDDYEGATDFSSRLVWGAPADGDYFIRVTNRADLSGCLTDYDIWVDRQDFNLSLIYLPLVLRAYGVTTVHNVRTQEIALAPVHNVRTQEVALAPVGEINHTCADAYEVDDTWQEAYPVEEGIPQVHSFDSDPDLYAADKDFVIFTVDSGRTVTFTVAAVTQTATLLELYGADGTALGVTGTAQLVWEAPASGTYYMGVSPQMDTFGCVGDAGYELMMEMSPLSKLYLPLVVRNHAP